MSRKIVVKVRPAARRTQILKEGDELEIAIGAPAEGGKANAELVRFLEKKIGKKVRIIRGKKSRRKVIELE